jgi:hypothetical protein
MTVVSLTPQKIDFNVAEAITLTASNTDGVTFTPPTGCERFVILFQNTSADTAYDITLKVPTNASHATAVTDLVTELAAGAVAALVVETARWADASTGKVLVDSENAAIKAAVIYY